MSAETVAALAVTDEIHAWDKGGAASAAALDAWVAARIAAHEEALKALLAVEGKRTLENTLRLYDVVVEQLNLAGAQANVLNSVAADKAVRDAAQLAAQKVAMVGAALSLNRGVYDALAAMDLTGRLGTVSAVAHFLQCAFFPAKVSGTANDLPQFVQEKVITASTPASTRATTALQSVRT